MLSKKAAKAALLTAAITLMTDAGSQSASAAKNNAPEIRLDLAM